MVKVPVLSRYDDFMLNGVFQRQFTNDWCRWPSCRSTQKRGTMVTTGRPSGIAAARATATIKPSVDDSPRTRTPTKKSDNRNHNGQSKSRALDIVPKLYSLIVFCLLGIVPYPQSYQLQASHTRVGHDTNPTTVSYVWVLVTLYWHGPQYQHLLLPLEIISFQLVPDSPVAQLLRFTERC